MQAAGKGAAGEVLCIESWVGSPRTSLGVIASRNMETSAGGNGAEEEEYADMLHQANGRPCFLWGLGLLTSPRASSTQGARGCRNCRQAGSRKVQLWGFLSPLGFTHPLSIRRACSPLGFLLGVRVRFNDSTALGWLS